VTLPADLRYEGLDCTGFTADVSRTGAFVRAGDEADPVLAILQPGDLIQLHLSPQGGEALIIPAQVVHKQGAGVGIAFRRAEPSFDRSIPRAQRS
jgi:hypothetical protein